MKFWRSLFLLIPMFSVSILISGCASTAKKGYEQYVGRAIFDIPNSYKSNEVVDKVYDAVAKRATNMQQTKLLFPEQLPDTPEKPVIENKELGFGPYSFNLISIKCGNAWVSISGQEPDLKSSYGTTDTKGYKACIYPYKDGYRAYVFGLYTYSENDSLTGLIARGIKKAVTSAVCKDDKYFNCLFDQIISKLKENVPDGKMVSLEYPQQ